MTVNAINSVPGFPEHVTLKDDTFKGDQIGICVAITNNETCEIEKDYIPDDAKKYFTAESLLNDKNIKFVTRTIAQFNKDETKLVNKTMHYLPYANPNCSKYSPTVMDEPVACGCNTRNELEIEVALALNENITRYLTCKLVTKNISMLELIHDIFESEDTITDTFPNDVKWDNGYDDDDTGLHVTMYFDYGDEYEAVFPTADAMMQAITSVRIISNNLIIED